MILSNLQQREHWAIACVFLCLLQWFSIAAHALPSYDVLDQSTSPLLVQPELGLKPNVSADAHQEVIHCHGMHQSDMNIAELDLNATKQMGHSCCDDGCTMIDCHLTSAMVASPSIAIAVSAPSIDSFEAVHSIRLYLTSPDRPPAQ